MNKKAECLFLVFSVVVSFPVLKIRKSKTNARAKLGIPRTHVKQTPNKSVRQTVLHKQKTQILKRYRNAVWVCAAHTYVQNVYVQNIYIYVHTYIHICALFPCIDTCCVIYIYILACLPCILWLRCLAE